MPERSIAAAFSAKGADPDSAQATRVAPIQFKGPTEHDFPVILFRCFNAVGTIITAKEWHFKQFESVGRDISGLLRVEHQKAEKIDNSKEGTLLFLHDAAYLGAQEVPVGVMALVMPKDSHVRFWYSVSSYNSLLVILKGKGYIEPLKTLEVRPNHLMFDPKRSLGPTDLRPDHHCRVYVWLREVFLRALEVPHSADYLNAMSLTNFAPDIVDPDTAIKRLDNNEHLYSTLPGRDMTDDRYLLELEPPERAIASMCDLKCAEYLLIKHTFFREFYWEVMRSEKKIGGEEKRERVRSDTAHQQWLQQVYDLAPSRAKKMVLAWRELGLLDEGRLLPWIKNGGMLEGTQADEGE